MSSRAIAPVVGASIGTVHADLSSGVQNRTPDAEPRTKTGLLAIVPSGPLGGATIAAKLNVSTRTIESDTAKLRDEAPET